MNKNTDKIYEEQTENLYASIGRFAVEFEHVCNYLSSIIMTILTKEGLENENVIQILLADQTAEPLRALVMALIPEILELSDKDKKIVKNIITRVQELTKKRNEVVHGTWYVGWFGTDKDEFTVAPGRKYKKNKNGCATKKL